jgi:hypothetical protein
MLVNQYDACKSSIKQQIPSIILTINRGVLGSSLYTCTDTTYTHYFESKEVDTVSFAAKMNDIVILPLPIQAMPVIACQDRLLRPLNVNLKKCK